MSWDPRLDRATAQGVIPIQICTIFEPESGLTCPDGWQRPATAVATIDGTTVPGVLVFAQVLRVDQGEISVQHPLD